MATETTTTEPNGAPDTPPPAPTEADALQAAIAASQDVSQEPPPDETPSAETEAAPAAETPAEPEGQTVDVQQYWAHATRLDRENRALKEQLKGLRAPDDVQTELKAEAAQNPAAFAEKFGLTLDKVLGALAGGGEEEPAAPGGLSEDKIVEKIMGKLSPMLEQAKAAETKRVQAEQAASEQQLYNTVIGNIRDIAEEAPEKYELTRAFDKMPLVVETAVQLTQAYSIGPEVDRRKVLEVALEHVEKHLAEQEEARLESLRGTKRFGTVFTPREQAAAAPAPQQGASLGTAPASETPTPREMTEEEALKAAVAAMQKASQDT